jgi:hypothetical protein
VKVRFLSVAEQEYRDAYDYYEGVVEGLGMQFKEELVIVLKRIEEFPEAWQRVSSKSRRCRLDHFPYGLIYQVRPTALLVVAVMHLGKEPGYWVKRLR